MKSLLGFEFGARAVPRPSHRRFLPRLARWLRSHRASFLKVREPEVEPAVAQEAARRNAPPLLSFLT